MRFANLAAQAEMIARRTRLAYRVHERWALTSAGAAAAVQQAKAEGSANAVAEFEHALPPSRPLPRSLHALGEPAALTSDLREEELLK